MSGVDNPDEIDVVEGIIAEVMSRVRTLVPGIVVAYDPLLGTAKVQVARRGADSEGRPYDQPIVPAAKVMWMRFGGMIIMGALNPGDEVALAVPHRSFDTWDSTGQLSDIDALDRQFDYGSSVVLMGLSSTPNALPQAPGQLIIGREDGTGTIKITLPPPGATSPATVEIEGAVLKLGALATESGILGDLFKAFFDAHVHPDPVSGSTGVPSVAMPAPTLSTKVLLE